MFASLFNNPRTKKMSLVVVATAALLVVALLSLAIVAIVNAVRATPPEEEPAPNGNGIPAGFVTTTFAENQLYKGALITVNDTYLFHTEANADVEMISVEQGRAKVDGSSLYSSNALGTPVQKEALDAMNAMLLAFYEEKGDDNLWVNVNADGYYAAGNTFELRYTTGVSGAPRPAISESSTYDWIFTNAYKYGFVPMFEAPAADDTEAESLVHIFRYVGTVHAQIMKDKKISTFDAYLTYLRDNTSPSKNATVTVEKKVYKVYYLSKDAQQIIPEKYKDAYTVSGDNMGGYIVTYCTTVSK